jgi:hypothetical protein
MSDPFFPTAGIPPDLARNLQTYHLLTGISPLPCPLPPQRLSVEACGDTPPAAQPPGLVSLETSPKSFSSGELYEDYGKDKRIKGAFGRAVRGLQSAGVADYAESFSYQDSEPVEGDLVLDVRRARGKRMKSSLTGAAALVQQRLAASGSRWKAAMLTATYRDEDEFEQGQLSRLMDNISKWGQRHGVVLPYIWVLERGENRGRLHYHIIVWLPKGLTLPKPDKQGWWPWGMTNIQWARSPAGYLAKYAGKGLAEGSMPLPKGSRCHGRGGLTVIERCKLAWARAPGWVRDYWPEWESKPRPQRGGGWVSKESGEWLPSPWRLVGFCRGSPIIRWVADVFLDVTVPDGVLPNGVMG